jgi:Holliday junction resolvase-like predicted endonuclease
LLVVVEVKWRRASAASEGAVSAWPPAQRRRAAEAWLSLHPGFPDGESRPWRFDLVTIDEDEHGLRLEHRRGAWSPGAGWW